MLCVSQIIHYDYPIINRSLYGSPSLGTGYAHRRTLGFDAAISDGDNNEIAIGATTYVFRKRVSDEEYAKLQKAKKKAQKKKNTDRV